jgi:hypothetical protein
MKKKLVQYNEFKEMESNSLTTAQRELVAAEDVLSNVLETSVSLYCFSENDVIYETINGDYVRAQYEIEDGKINLENLENLVIDENSLKEESQSILSAMVDSLLEGNEEKAKSQFDSYISSPTISKVFEEAATMTVSKGLGKVSKLKGKKQSRHAVMKRAKARKLNTKWKESHPGLAKQIKTLAGRLSKKLGHLKTGKGGHQRRVYTRYNLTKKKMVEWVDLCHNVLEYVDFHNYGPVLHETQVSYNDDGSTAAVSIPTTHKRNESKWAQSSWKALNGTMKALRTEAKDLNDDEDFCKALADLKRSNAMSDNDALEETLEGIVTKWPSVLYLTQDELAQKISGALESVGSTNFDDHTCVFMSEGILRSAHNAYSDRVDRIEKLSGSENNAEESEDSYVDFQETIKEFYPTLDEDIHNNLNVFEAVYQAIGDVYRQAEGSRDDALKEGALEHLELLANVLNQDIQPDLNIAESASEWLYILIEANLDNVDFYAKPHVSGGVMGDSGDGDHPAVSDAADKAYSPAKDFAGDDKNRWKMAGEEGKSLGDVEGTTKNNPYIFWDDAKTKREVKDAGAEELGDMKSPMGNPSYAQAEKAGDAAPWPPKKNPFLLNDLKPSTPE